MPNFKSVLLNAFKHLGLSILSIAGAAVIGYASNDTGLLKLLTDAGVPGFVAIALVPLLHSAFVILQKKYLPGVADANTPVEPK
jgi:hypothetical protein